jgi:broad specificity phosphatase PhoE
MDATIHLVRHGEVENPKGIIYGRMPGYHLSERGQRQAEAAADRLQDQNIGAVWSSPLERAQETAQAIAQPHDAQITLDDRLLETNSTLEGVGRTIASLLKSPRHWWHLRNPFKPSWGESFADIRLRMMAAIDDAAEAAKGREAVIVSHQTPVIVARLSLARSRMPPWIGFTPCHVGSVTTLVIEDGRVVSASYFAPSV